MSSGDSVSTRLQRLPANHIAASMGGHLVSPRSSLTGGLPLLVWVFLVERGGCFGSATGWLGGWVAQSLGVIMYGPLSWVDI